MADERCVYENVLRDATSLCIDIFVKLQTILMETSDHSNPPAKRIMGIVVQLFTRIALYGELHVRLRVFLVHHIDDVIKNGACEHGFRYKGLVDYDAFWDVERLRTLKDAKRATQHRHVAVGGIAPVLDRVKNGAQKEIKETSR